MTEFRKGRAVTQASKHGERRASRAIATEKRRARRTTRRLVTAQLRLEDGDHKVTSRLDAWAIY